MTAVLPPAETGIQTANLPRYDLSAQELSALQGEMVSAVATQHGETVAAVWLPSDSPYANVVRTFEAVEFPEIPTIMGPYERECRFLAMVDTRGSNGRIIHAFRISRSGLTADERVGTDEEGAVKIAFIQDLVGGGEITEAEITDFYRREGVNLDDCISVETNFRVGVRAERLNGLPISDLGYLAIFNSVASAAEDTDRAGVFAHLNTPAIISLGRVGVQYEPVAGRPDLKTPTMEPGDVTAAVKFDPHYSPKFIPGSVANLELFRQLAPFAPPTLELAERIS